MTIEAAPRPNESACVERSFAMEGWGRLAWYLLISASSLVLPACQRRELAVRTDPVTKPSATTSVPSTTVPSTKTSSAPKDSAPPEAILPVPPPMPADTTPEPKPKLVPFLSVMPPTIPPGAYVGRPSTATPYAPAGFDPLHAKVDHTWHLPDGNDVLGFEMSDGPSDTRPFVVIVNGGKVTHTYDIVVSYTVDDVGGQIAISHVRPDPGGKLVFAREIVDVATGGLTPLPAMTCTDSLAFVDGGARLLGNGWEFDPPSAPYGATAPHAHICLFDAAGKLLAKIDAGLHNHHAASADFINMATGVLPKDGAVVWATREYESYGNYDVTLVDTRPPYARKVARLPTPRMLGRTEDLQIDFADTTMASTEVRFRGRSNEGWWWQWQTAPLVDAP